MGRVAEALRLTARDAIMPVYQRGEAAPQEVEPGEWVTTADIAAEAMLTPLLLDLMPNSRVVGEEAAHANPALLDALGDRGAVWLLDPLDGTANFAAGQPPFRVMVALLVDGETTASWIFNPISGDLATAMLGEGAYLNTEHITTVQDRPTPEEMQGAVLRRFLPPEIAQRVSQGETHLARVSSGSGCAGVDYIDLARGVLDFVLYWRTLPWDHIPGALFLNEAGGSVLRIDGSRYLAGDHARPGLLAAANPEAWASAHALLLAP